MKFKLKHLGEIKEGKVKYDDPKAFLQVVKELEGERVEVVIKKFKEYKQRSEEQNNYYWGGIVTPLAEYFGYTIDEMHEVIKLYFLGTKKEVKGKDGKVRTLCKAGSTALLSKAQFAELTSKIRSWSSLDYGIYLLSPEQYQRKISYEPTQV